MRACIQADAKDSLIRKKAKKMEDQIKRERVVRPN